MVGRDRRKLFALWIPLIIAVFAYALGDVLLKQGNMDLGSTLEGLLQGSFWFAFFMSLPIVLAFSLTISSKLLMGKVLSKNDLGTSEGIFLALSILLLFLFGIFFFTERANIQQLVGLFFVMGGILMVSSREDENNETDGY